jgi:hypothetical protein
MNTATAPEKMRSMVIQALVFTPDTAMCKIYFFKDCLAAPCLLEYFHPDSVLAALLKNCSLPPSDIALIRDEDGRLLASAAEPGIITNLELPKLAKEKINFSGLAPENADALQRLLAFVERLPQIKALICWPAKE